VVHAAFKQFPGYNMTSTTYSESSPHKPCSDKRTYKHLILKNGLRALLIQDHDVVFATACANVQVGYFDDPLDMPGLAHYVEHMVHLGSKGYPDEKEYKHFLGQHGGASNASTGGCEM
jgi:secreted Zn-dependent insulinase-like peptidase